MTKIDILASIVVFLCILPYILYLYCLIGAFIRNLKDTKKHNMDIVQAHTITKNNITENDIIVDDNIIGYVYLYHSRHEII